MAYQIKNSKGEVLATIPDTRIDKDSTSLALVGYNSTKYGVDLAENFVKLMENFASEYPPENPIEGQLWFDSAANMLKIRKNSSWGTVSGSSSVSGDPTLGGIAGVYHYEVADTSVLLILAGGTIIGALAKQPVANTDLPTGITIDSTEYAMRAQFPHGLLNGINLANPDTTVSPDDFSFHGRVPVAEQAVFTGGGAAASQVSGWGYMDLGAGKSVGFMMSNGALVAAVASAPILAADLPSSISFYIRRERDTTASAGSIGGLRQQLEGGMTKVTISNLAARFPARDYNELRVNSLSGEYYVSSTTPNVALFPGLTFAVNGEVDLGNQGSTAQAMIALNASAQNANATALASAMSAMRVWVDSDSAVAMKVDQIETSFTTGTGQSSLSEAINTIITAATDSSAVASAITSLKSEFTSALGTASFSEALSKLSTTATQTSANTSSINSVTSSLMNRFGGSSVAQAVSNLHTAVTSSGTAVSGWSLSLNSNGYVTGVQALNGGASNNYFKVTASRFMIGDNNLDFIPFEVRNGVVYMKDVVAENITYNSLIPAFSAGNNSLNPTNGFQKLPGGMILQWGRVRRYIADEQAFSVSFPIAFPTGCMAVSAMPYITTFNNNRDLWMQNVGEPTTSGCVFATQSSTKNSQLINGFDWMAYGY